MFPVSLSAVLSHPSTTPNVELAGGLDLGADEVTEVGDATVEGSVTGNGSGSLSPSRSDSGGLKQDSDSPIQVEGSGGALQVPGTILSDADSDADEPVAKHGHAQVAHERGQDRLQTALTTAKVMLCHDAGVPRATATGKRCLAFAT